MGAARGAPRTGRGGPFGNRVAEASAELPCPEQVPVCGTSGERSHFDPGAGFWAMTTSIAFRWGTPPAWETNSTCPESKICQSQ